MIHLFKRVTSSGKYIAEIDDLRFLAIFLVVLFLSNFWSSKICGNQKSTFWYIIDMGNIGVQLFFVISGFIIAMPFIKFFSNSKSNSQYLFILKKKLIDQYNLGCNFKKKTF